MWFPCIVVLTRDERLLPLRFHQTWAAAAFLLGVLIDILATPNRLGGWGWKNDVIQKNGEDKLQHTTLPKRRTHSPSVGADGSISISFRKRDLHDDI